MDKKEILQAVDHTLLSQTATWEEIRQICDDGITYGCASVCIPPSYVKRAKEYVGDKIAVCTVIGFSERLSDNPGQSCGDCDCLVANGADEIDMVINIGDLKDGCVDKVEQRSGR